ncbi:MAG: hypothetical protein LBM69_08105 [Lachnospiraceae bacterium]|jgi:hypothetical protein|nr:hypothetical protein [Lachnospiraceae bacterium]
MKVNVKKSILKGVVFGITFMVALVLIGEIMNRGNYNMTMDLASATLPVVSMELLTDSGEYMTYNELHGYQSAMNVPFMRDHITELGTDRDTYFTIEPYGATISDIAVEIRSLDGSRLIEHSPVTEYVQEEAYLRGHITLKDLIERDTEYAMIILLSVDEEILRYYTKVIWSDHTFAQEKLQFVNDFHHTLYDKQQAQKLAMYMESDETGDNTSFHNVDIHSSFQMITWGDLRVEELTKPTIAMKELILQTASVTLQYIVRLEDQDTLYQVDEFYRIRYTPDRVYLLDFKRSLTQIPDENSIFQNDKIVLGIVNEDVPYLESEDGNILVFEVANKLLSYNISTNKVTVIFSFYDQRNMDSRSRYTKHAIKILDTDEGGNVRFAVYGYMNRGRHEGNVGVLIYRYDSVANTIEEVVFLPYLKSFEVLQAEMERLLYLNRDGILYLFLENTVTQIDTVNQTYAQILSCTQDDTMQVSDNHKILVWQQGEDYHRSSVLTVKNLSSGATHQIAVDEDESIRPLGFMGEDIIFGVAKQADISWEREGGVLFPMYKVCIQNADGTLLKEYSEENQLIYVTEAEILENQIILKQIQKEEDGSYQETSVNHITNNTKVTNGKNTLSTVVIEKFAKYVQIQMRNTVTTDTLKILIPKEVMFEGNKLLIIEPVSESPRYYVYGPYGVEKITNVPAVAIDLAYQHQAVVTDENGQTIWNKANRNTRIQISAIKESIVTEDSGSLAVCLEAMLTYEGNVRNAQYLLDQGETAATILREGLDDHLVLELTGCALDAVLYYVNQRTPILATVEGGEAVLVVGYNEFNVILMEPSTGRIYQKGKNDSAAYFEDNGNRFLTYIR